MASNGPRPARRRGAPPTRDDIASLATAHVYGGIIAFAALALVDPREAGRRHSLALVAGAGFSTFVAHVFSGMIGHRIRSEARVRARDVLHEARLSLPIVNSALIPAGCLVLATAGLIPAVWSFGAAAGVIALRLAFLDMLISRASGRGGTVGILLSGLGFAAVCIAVAVVKVALSH